MPPRIPKIMPAMNPPPIMRLKIANGNIITSARAPLPIAMIIAPRTNVRPISAPSMKAYDGPIVGSQKNMEDHIAQKVGDSNAALFSNTMIPDRSESTTAMIFLPPSRPAETSRGAGGGRTTWGLPQKGQ